jgi:hypothetical protein
MLGTLSTYLFVSVVWLLREKNDVQYDYNYRIEDRTDGPQNPDFTRPQLGKEQL